jgi:hypothetical protein
MRITDTTTRTFTLVLEADEMHDLKFLAFKYVERYGDGGGADEPLALAYDIFNHDNDNLTVAG